MAGIFSTVYDCTPALWRVAQGERSGRRPVPRGRADAATLRLQLSNAPQSERRGHLIAFVRQQAMKTLGVSEPIDVSQPLRELGLDSLMSITLVNRLEATLGIRVSTAKLIQGPSIEDLVDDTFAELLEGDDLARRNRRDGVADRWRRLARGSSAHRRRASYTAFLLSVCRRRLSRLSKLGAIGGPVHRGDRDRTARSPEPHQ